MPEPTVCPYTNSSDNAGDWHCPREIHARGRENTALCCHECNRIDKCNRLCCRLVRGRSCEFLEESLSALQEPTP